MNRTSHAMRAGGWPGPRAAGAGAIALALLLAAGCGRKAEDEWTVPELPGSSLADEPTTGDPASGSLVLRRVPSAGAGRTYQVVVEHDVRIRERAQSAVAISMHEAFEVAESESVDDGRSTATWTVPSADVAVDPADEDTQPALEDGLKGVSLRRPLAATGVGPGAPADGPAREVGDAMDRLVLPLPDRAVVPGETWPFRQVSTRPLEAGTSVQVERVGTVRFAGMAADGDSLLALVDATWDVRITGAGTLGGRPGRVTRGEGRGRAAGLVDPDGGVTVRADGSEATHLVLEVRGGPRTSTVEQVALLTSELTLREPAE